MSPQAATDQAKKDQEEVIRFTQKILKTLDEDLMSNRIEPVKVLAVMIKLSNAQTKEELKSTIEELIQDYPQLKEVLLKEKAELADTKDDLVESFASELIKKDPVAAQKFIAFANINELEAIFDKYPEFQDYINSKN